MAISEVHLTATFQRLTPDEVTAMMNAAIAENVTLDVEFKGQGHSRVSFDLGGHDIDANLDSLAKLRSVVDQAEL